TCAHRHTDTDKHTHKCTRHMYHSNQRSPSLFLSHFCSPSQTSSVFLCSPLSLPASLSFSLSPFHPIALFSLFILLSISILPNLSLSLSLSLALFLSLSLSLSLSLCLPPLLLSSLT